MLITVMYPSNHNFCYNRELNGGYTTRNYYLHVLVSCEILAGAYPVWVSFLFRGLRISNL